MHDGCAPLVKVWVFFYQRHMPIVFTYSLRGPSLSLSNDITCTALRPLFVDLTLPLAAVVAVNCRLSFCFNNTAKHVVVVVLYPPTAHQHLSYFCYAHYRANFIGGTINAPALEQHPPVRQWYHYATSRGCTHGIFASRCASQCA